MKTTTVNCDVCKKLIPLDKHNITIPPVFEIILSIRAYSGKLPKDITGDKKYSEVCFECANDINDEFNKKRKREDCKSY